MSTKTIPVVMAVVLALGAAACQNRPAPQPVTGPSPASQQLGPDLDNELALLDDLVGQVVSDVDRISVPDQEGVLP